MRIRLAALDPRRVWQLVLDLLKMGLTPEKLAMTVVLGAVIGVLPVLGSTTILCGIVAVALGLNVPVIQAVNYLVYPLQIAMIIPFIRAGAWIFGAPQLGMTATELVAFVTHDPKGAIMALWWVTVQALVAWGIFAFATSALGYPLLVYVRRRRAPAREATP